jgi:tryptophan synthase beta chain
MKMYTLGHDFMPPGIHAGGLRYHGDSPLVSQLYHEGLIEAVAVSQLATFEAGVMFARAEGIIPAPESNHAIRAAIDEALRCKQNGEAKTIFFNLTGHGHFDMAAYDRYFAGELEDFEYPAEAIRLHSNICRRSDDRLDAARRFSSDPRQSAVFRLGTRLPGRAGQP